ncbi:MAG: hypothetical protein EXS03_06050 [Phycisphaerales bacterium]|nr:hypothetical protein [Phycisphaerales bacterium]
MGSKPRPGARSAARPGEKSKLIPAKAKPVPAPVPLKKHQPPTAPQLTKLPPPKQIFVMPKSIVGEPPPPPKRSKGAPPPVIAKPKVKHKAASSGDRSREPRKKIDMAHAVTVAQAAARAAATQKVVGGYVVINGRKVRVVSVKGVKIPRKKAGQVKLEAGEDDSEVSTAPVKLGKCRIPAKELERYHAMLLKLRTELVGRVEGTEKEALKSNDGNLSTMPLHMADIGTDTFEQDFALGIAQHDRAIVVEVDEALARVKDGTYGLCLMSGKAIPRGRLQAKPWAKYTIETERIVERTRGRT